MLKSFDMLAIDIISSSHLLNWLVHLRLIQLFLFRSSHVVYIFVIQFFKSDHLVLLEVVILFITRHPRNRIIFKSVSNILISFFGSKTFVTAFRLDTVFAIAHIFWRFCRTAKMIRCFHRKMIKQSIFFIGCVDLFSVWFFIIVKYFDLILLKSRCIIFILVLLIWFIVMSSDRW